ncbi:MAG: gamma-glutamyl-gamma-aminobutyrate hydrolase family protein [Pseudomonadota bacterium]
MSRPVVAIIGNSYLIDGGYPVHATGRMNSEAIAHVSNALPVMLPSMPSILDIPELIETFDGFLLTGARPNVHPDEYGEDATDAHGEFDRERDGITLPLIRASVDSGKPIFGICRGFQEFNVAYGGTLYPEIRDLPGRMNHRMPPDGTLDEKFALRHDVHLSEGGKFEAIFGTTTIRTNTLHGQGIKEKGARIVIEGVADDDTPEAIHVDGAPSFAMAVQWHPEYNAAEDPVSRPLFAAFGKSLRSEG